ncbi:hypothetical protein, partial [Enterobacter hormaechei]|uniref:hypothetical protein n=1 Tax=Enterobacter hormaechei TaxID=158836 RepID=UPI0013D4E8F6
MSYEYRTSGEISAIRNSGGSALVSFTYDDLGRRIGIGRANGTQSGYAYDDASQLREVVQD